MKIIDLSVQLYEGLQSNPTHPKMIITDHVTHWFTAPRYKLPCKGYASKLLLISDHMGTHLDAPVHFIEDGKTIDEVPLEQTMGEAIFIDLSNTPVDEPVTALMLQNKLKDMNMEIKENDIVILKKWPGEWNGPGFYQVAGVDISAAKWLAEQKIKSLGLDIANADTGSDMQRPCHMVLLEKNIGIIENLTNLDKLSKNRFFFIGTPLNIKGLTASPIRAIAIEEW